MYERYFGLSERPFDLTANPRFLFLTARHREALSNLQYGISAHKGLTVLVGEAGTGKTTLVRAAIELQRSQQVHSVFLYNPTLTRPEFYEFLAAGFGLSARAAASKATFLLELSRMVVDRHRAGAVSALIVDEAQSLPHELLEELRLLSNLENNNVKLLPLVLIGQPELADRLNEPSLRQLKQRVGLRCALTPLDLRETAAYITKRLRIAGGNSAEIFTRDAVELIYQRSRGIPRTINVICDNAMVTAFAVDLRPIDAAVVQEVTHDFDLDRLPATAPVIAAPSDPLFEPDPAEATASEPAALPGPAAEPSREIFGDFGKRRRLSFF
jgi:general secretion pathway protein A